MSEQNGIKGNNLYALLDRYWRSGKSKNGLLPLYSNCGARGKSRKNCTEKPGVKSPEGKPLSDADCINFERTIQRYYLTRQKRSLRSTYEKLLQDFYTEKSDDGRLKLLESSKLPTFWQFQRWYYKNVDIVSEKKKRDGERDFELNSRAVLGKSDYGLMGPGAQFQVDATVGDVYLLSQFDHSSIIGRPVLYFIIDAFSRMVTGTVKFAMLPTDNATITEKGIRFKGLYYNCDRAKSEMWFEKARAKKYWSITVSYDPREMTNIYIWDGDLKRYDACYLLDWNSKNVGKTLAEIIYEQQKERLAGKRLKATATEAKVNLNAEIDSIVAEAKQISKSNGTKSKSERVSGIRA